MRELAGRHLVRPPRDRHGAHRRQVGFRRGAGGGFSLRAYLAGPRAAGGPGSGALVARRNDLRYRLRDPSLIGSFDRICSIMRFASSESQIWASPFSENSPFALMIGWTTIAPKRPAGTSTVSRRST